jgi:hypothetical protein
MPLPLVFCLAILVVYHETRNRRWLASSGFPPVLALASCGGKIGRPAIPPDLMALIKRLAKDNPLWGVPRIQAELHLLGHEVAASTISKYLPRGRKPPSQTWKTFLHNHVDCLACSSVGQGCHARLQCQFGCGSQEECTAREARLRLAQKPRKPRCALPEILNASCPQGTSYDYCASKREPITVS